MTVVKSRSGRLPWLDEIEQFLVPSKLAEMEAELARIRWDATTMRLQAIRARGIGG